METRGGETGRQGEGRWAMGDGRTRGGETGRQGDGRWAMGDGRTRGQGRGDRATWRRAMGDGIWEDKGTWGQREGRQCDKAMGDGRREMGGQEDFSLLGNLTTVPSPEKGEG